MVKQDELVINVQKIGNIEYYLGSDAVVNYKKGE